MRICSAFFEEKGKKRTKIKTFIGWILILALLSGPASMPVSAKPSLCSYASEIGNESNYSYAERKESPIYGRNVLFFGDSFCNAREEREGGKPNAGYAGHIGMSYNMNWENYGASGYALAEDSFPNATICYIIMYQMPLGSKDGQPVLGIRHQSSYIALQKQILEKREIPYLDLHNDTEFNENIFKVTTTQYLSGDRRGKRNRDGSRVRES